MTSISPSDGYLVQRQNVKLSGTNFLNVHSLLVRMTLLSTNEPIYLKQFILYLDAQTLLFVMPNGAEFDLRGNR